MYADVRDRVVIARGYVDARGFRMDPRWVIRHDGRVRAASVEGGGRTFTDLAAVLRGDMPPTDGTGRLDPDVAPLVLVIAVRSECDDP